VLSLVPLCSICSEPLNWGSNTGTKQSRRAVDDGTKLSEILEESFVRCRDLEAPLADRLTGLCERATALEPHFDAAIDALVSRSRRLMPARRRLRWASRCLRSCARRPRTIVRLSFTGKGPLALALSGHWCPYCRINVDSAGSRREGGRCWHRHVCRDRARSTKVRRVAQIEAKAPFPVLMDIDNGYADDLDLAFYVGDALKQMMVSFGWDPSVSQGTDIWMLPIPATFIIGTDGIISRRFHRPGLPNAHGHRGPTCRAAVRDVVPAPIA